MNNSNSGLLWIILSIFFNDSPLYFVFRKNAKEKLTKTKYK